MHFNATLRSEITEQYNAQDGARTIKEIVKEIPFSEHTSKPPFKSTDSNWKSTTVDPTWQEYFDQEVLEKSIKLSDLSSTIDKVLNPAKEDWIEVSSILLDDVYQRNQSKDPEASNNVKRNAWNFRYDKADVWLGLLNQPGHEYHKRFFAINGGGTLCSAVLRGIEYIPARITEVFSMEELGELFNEVATSTVKIKGEDRYKYRLMCNDPLAMLQHRVFRETDTTPVRNHPDKTLTMLPLTALAKMLKESFANNSDTSISGDSQEQLRDESMYDTRTFDNIVDVTKAIKHTYPEEQELVPAFFKELVRWYASTNGVVTFTRLCEMLQDYKTGVVTIRNKKQTAGGIVYNIHPMAVPGELTFDTQKDVVENLGLQDQTESHRMYGTYVFSKLWNNWAKSRPGIQKIQEHWLEKRIEDGKSKSYWYNPKINYKAEFDKYAKQIEAI